MDSMQYEFFRNMTLLFFYETLIDNGGNRSLQNLSCLFGRKNFTKEMRQITGSSKKGLKNFLSQYPVLFKIKGNIVYLNEMQNVIIKENGTCVTGERDYAREASEYFSNKLLQYGVGTEVPLKCLLGHRSQAPPEVRHVSGQRFKEFRDFLLKYPDVFVVTENNVILKEYEGMKSQRYSETDSEIKIDPEVTAKLLDFIANHIEQKGVLLMDQLFNLVVNKFPCNEMFKTAQDLSIFIKMFPDAFNVNNNLVTLIKRPKAFLPDLSQTNKTQVSQKQINCYNEEAFESNMEIKAIDFLKDQIEAGCTILDKLFFIITKQFVHGLDMFQSSQDLLNFIKSYPNTFHVQKLKNSRDYNVSLNITKLDVTTTDNVRNTNVQKNHQSSFNQSPVSLNSDSTTSDTNSQQNSLQTMKSNISSPVHGKQQSFKQQFNNLVMKIIAENTEKDRNIQAAQFDNEVDILQNVRVVVNVRECIQIVDEIMHSKKHVIDDRIVISIDCEGVCLGTVGRITMLQIGTLHGQAYIFDLLACPVLINDGKLKMLLECETVTKVIHDCRNDSGNLYRQFGITMRNVFDTQAAHAVLLFQNTKIPVHKTKDIGLNDLCDLYGGSTNILKEQFKNVYRKDKNFWSRRPITTQMLRYAGGDVLSLVPHVYNSMYKLIESDSFNLLTELCEEQVLMLIKPTCIKRRKKQRKIESEVADLREKMEEATGKNIVLSNREIRLLHYLELTDVEKEKLKGNCKVARRLEKLENMAQEKGDSIDDEDEEKRNDDPDYTSLDSCNSENSNLGEFMSPRNTEPPSLTESMHMLEEIISDRQMDGIEKIDRLEEILSKVTCTTSDFNSFETKCKCQSMENTKSTQDVGCQTLSTGDIVITRIFYTDEKKEMKAQKQ